MEDIQKKTQSDNYLKIISKDCYEKIVEQMEKNKCQIKREDGWKWKPTGFLCSIKNNNDTINVMMTNYNCLDEKYINEYKEIELMVNNEYKKIKINNNRKIDYNKNYDLTIIEILKEDEIKNFMELDDKLLSVNKQ